MNLKDFSVFLAFVLIVTSAFNYFFTSRQPDTSVAVADRSFIAPATAYVSEPLDYSIDFSGKDSKREKQLTLVNTPTTLIEFSNDGAIIERLAYRRLLSGQESIMETIVPTESKDQGAFLVALNGLDSTPYYYDLIEQKAGDTTTLVSYKGESATATVIKQYTVYNTLYKIDLSITIEPKNKENAVRARLFLPGPKLLDTDGSDALKAIVAKENKSLEKKHIKDVQSLGKEKPTLFGLEDRYFINALIADPQGFAQRAYFKLDGLHKAQAVYQTAPIHETTTWTMSFYCGPKEVDAFAQVDKRLDGSLDYGWLAAISKPLLYLLNFLNKFLKNYGLSIIALTLLIKLALAPFTFKSEKNRKNQLEMQRKIKYVEQKYHHDPEMLNKAKSEITTKYGMSNMLGCLPLFLQLPIFIGLNRVLSNSIELYRAPFAWIPDLSGRDPYYILPVLVGVSTILQLQSAQRQGNDPRQLVVNFLIALAIAAFTSNLAAGLALFISVSTFLSIAQTYITKAVKA